MHTTVTCCIIVHYRLCSNIGVGISEECFIFEFASLTMGVARLIQPAMCTTLAVRHQLSSSSDKTQINISQIIWNTVLLTEAFDYPKSGIFEHYTQMYLSLSRDSIYTVCICDMRMRM